MVQYKVSDYLSECVTVYDVVLTVSHKRLTLQVIYPNALRLVHYFQTSLAGSAQRKILLLRGKRSIYGNLHLKIHPMNSNRIHIPLCHVSGCNLNTLASMAGVKEFRIIDSRFLLASKTCK